MGEQEARDMQWGRRAIWGKSPKVEEKKALKGGGTTMMDASPAPIRLPIHENVVDKGKGKGKVEEEEGGDEGKGEEKEEGEEDEWDEESLVRLSDWWRQILARGRDPTWQELDMMDAFLGDLLEEDTPSLEMILTTRLHKLLEALIKAADEQGLRYEGARYRRVARKAAEVQDKWMKDMGGKLYDMRNESRKMLTGNKGRLSRVHMRPMGEHGWGWVVEQPFVEEGEFEPGM